MSTFAAQESATDKSQLSSNSPNTGLLSQRKYAFGVSKSSLTSEYEGKTRLQAKLTIGASNDPLEQEADRVADQVLAAPMHSAVSGAAPSIQRFTGQSTGDAGTAPASIDRVLSGSGRPLDPAIQQDMGRRFGHDFSRVRVHTDSAAEQSAMDVGAHAYTVGSSIVFGAGEFAPESHVGRKLIAHELTHVVQQSGTARTHVDQGNIRPRLSPIRVMRSGLADVNNQKLTFDTDKSSRDLNKFFGLSGTPTLASNVTADYSYQVDSIDALKDAKTQAALKQGLRLYTLGLFDLLPDDKGLAHSKRLNLVHVENMDLARWGGPKESFRFTSVGQADATGKITVQILIESLGLTQNYMSKDTTAPGIEKMAAKYGLHRDMNYDPLATVKTSVDDVTWNKVLRSMGRVPEWILMRLRDVTFEMSTKDKGPKGEAAEYQNTMNGNTITRKIILYADMINASEQDFAFTIEHEIGHALDYAPAESSRGVDQAKMGHSDPEFLKAAKADGGRAASVTQYGKTDSEEFYAECFAMYISQPDTLAIMRPNIYKYFKTYQWGGLKDPKLNPYAPKPGDKPRMGEFGIIGPF
jgi:hypothetical protein